jgi:hypothetical protein
MSQGMQKNDEAQRGYGTILLPTFLERILFLVIWKVLQMERMFIPIKKYSFLMLFPSS